MFGWQQPPTHVVKLGHSAVTVQHTNPVGQAPPPAAAVQHVCAAVPQCGTVEPVGGGQHFSQVGAQVDWQAPVAVLMYPLQQ
ncbi:MAG: hypothetical protein QM692_11170 [Thermomicrobiales bacterium]